MSRGWRLLRPRPQADRSHAFQTETQTPVPGTIAADRGKWFTPVARNWLLAIPIILGTSILIVTVAVGVVWIVGYIRPDWWRRLPEWGLLAVGGAFFLVVIVGVILYMALSLKALTLHLRQSRFLDAVTHELKTPLASLRLYLETLARRELTDDQRREFYSAMLDEVDRLDALTEQLLNAARASGRRWSRARRPVLLLPVLEDCTARARSRYRLDEDAIRFEGEPLTVEAWEAGLRSIFDNLLDNAVKYSTDTPRVVVRAYECAPGRVRIEVKDRGMGLPPGLGKRLYGRFVRGDRYIERTRPGTGLGLYVCWSLARAMGGRLGHQVNDDGPGMTFFVELRGWRESRTY